MANSEVRGQITRVCRHVVAAIRMTAVKSWPKRVHKDSEMDVLVNQAK